MADSASESDSSSIDGGPIMMPPSPVTREQLHKRIESLQQQNRVYKVELETYKLRVKALQEENRHLRQTSVNIQAKAEQEEEFISNTLLKKIQALKKEKETLAHHYEQEEECLTNDLSRKLNQLRAEKCKLEQTLEQEQECLVNKLMRKIEKLEAETVAKQNNLEQLRREKVELENTLEQEQEALVNRLWKRMDKLEAEKRNLQNKANVGFGNRAPGGTVSGSNEVPSGLFFNRSESSSGTLHLLLQPRDSIGGSIGGGGGMSLVPGGDNNISTSGGNGDSNDNRGLLVNNSGTVNDGSRTAALDQDVITLSGNVQHLRNEVDRLKSQLNIAQQQHADKMAQFAMEEQQIRDENLRLQRRLQLEMERREALCRHLSESESSLEMEDERHFHESLVAQNSPASVNVVTPNNNTSGMGSGQTSAVNLTTSQQGVVPLAMSHAAMSASNSSSSVAVSSSAMPIRPRPVSSPGPFVPSPGSGSRPMSPGLQLSCNTAASHRDVMMSPPSPVSRCLMCNGNGFVLGGTCSMGGGPLVVTTSQAPGGGSGQFSNIVSSSSPPIRGSSRERFARPAPPTTSDRTQDPRTPGDSTMTSPAPSPSPLEVVMSPNAPTPSQSPSPMDTSRT